MKKNILNLALLLLILNLIALSAQKSGQEKIDSLLAELPSAKEDTNKVNLLNQLSSQHYTINSSKGLEYGMAGLKLAKSLNWRVGIANCYNSIGTNYWAQSKNSEALKYYKKALELNKELGDNKNITINLGNIGSVCYNMSDFEGALKYFQEALKINEELGRKKGISSNIGNIGNVYQNLSDYENALKYYQKALEIDEELGNVAGVARHSANIGLVYQNLSENKKALEYYKKAYDINKKNNRKMDMAINLGNIGIVYLTLFDYEKALQNYKMALEINTEIGNKGGMAVNYGNIGGLYLNLTKDSVLSRIESTSIALGSNKSSNIEKSLRYSLKAAEIAEEIGARDMLIEWYYNLQDAFKEKRDFESAYKYIIKHKETHDSLFTAESRDKINKMTEQYEREIKEKEAAALLAMELDEIRYRNTLQYLGILLFLILLIIVIFMGRKYDIRPGIVEASVFFTFLLFYEFITVMIEPWADGLSNQQPLYKLGINISVALLFIPLSKIESNLRRKFKAKS